MALCTEFRNTRTQDSEQTLDSSASPWKLLQSISEHVFHFTSFVAFFTQALDRNRTNIAALSESCQPRGFSSLEARGLQPSGPGHLRLSHVEGGTQRLFPDAGAMGSGDMDRKDSSTRGTPRYSWDRYILPRGNLPKRHVDVLQQSADTFLVILVNVS